jgi:hypothetical protein
MVFDVVIKRLTVRGSMIGLAMISTKPSGSLPGVRSARTSS